MPDTDDRHNKVTHDDIIVAETEMMACSQNDEGQLVVTMSGLSYDIILKALYMYARNTKA